MRALNPVPSPVHPHSSRVGSARLAQTPRIAPVYSKRSGDRRTTPSLDSVRAPPSIAVFALQCPDTAHPSHPLPLPRPLPTLDGLPLPPKSRGRQSPVVAHPSRVSDDRESVYSYA
jgi:hypothetical protein